MSILFSGDFHAGVQGELSCITKKAIIKAFTRKNYANIRYHIILGDGGFMWQGYEKKDLYNYETLALRPFPILCVLGNHEPIYGMEGLKETDIGLGETVYQINEAPFVAYLKRGKIYTIDGIKFLVLGGALSIDKNDRTPGKSWWENEYWTKQEEDDLFKLLGTDNNFDYVISHTGPHHINSKLFENQMGLSKKFYDEVALLNDEINNKILFRDWWCGHWHQDVFHYDTITKHGYHYMYKSIKILEKIDNEFTIHAEPPLEPSSFN